MDKSEEENLAWLACDFSSSAQVVAKFPNLVYSLNQVTMRCLLSEVGENCGIWGLELPGFQPLDAELWEKEFPLVEHHWMWGKPEYQDWLISQDGLRDFSRFQMIIPVGVPLQALRNVKRLMDTDRWGMDLLPELMNELPWASIDLTWGEMGDAVFVAGSACRELVERVINALIATSHARAQIELDQDGKAKWRRC